MHTPITLQNEKRAVAPARENGPQRYIPELDSFRFFAVFLVILSHWISGSGGVNRIPNGFIGVTFFFVLSGFLITSNLLYLKQNFSTGSITLGHALKIFYIRRTLRIFPLYYFVLFLALILVPAIYEGHFAWFALYGPNFLMFKLGHWLGMLSHFWTLGIEEQFYLVWPLLIFITPWDKLRNLFLITIATCLVYKMVLNVLEVPLFSWYGLLPFNCFDSFAVGAVLSVYLFRAKGLPKATVFHLGTGKSLFFIILIYIMLDRSGIYFLDGLLISFASFFLIAQAKSGFTGMPKRILANPALRYLGKISYGLYVYHNFIPWLLRCLMGTELAYPLHVPVIMNWQWLHGGIRIFLVEFVLLVLISTISWFVLEHPLNKLKRYFA